MTTERGLYCPHGHRLMVPDPAAPPLDSFPGLVFVPDDEWPCSAPECTRAQLEADFEQENADYERERWREYRDLTYGY